MSKLANHSIKYKPSVSVSVLGDYLEIKNSNTVSQLKLNGVKVFIDKENNSCAFNIDKKDKNVEKANLGTVVSLFKSKVAGFDKAHSLTLIAQGVGFKAMVLPGDMLLMWLGRSHLYCVKFPKEVVVVAKDNKILLSGDKVAVTMLASIIKTNRPWDPCMKKGIIIEGEFLVQKEGKKKK